MTPRLAAWMLLAACHALDPLHARGDDAPTYRLQYRFEPGQVVRYTSSHEGMLETTKGDLTETARNRSETDKHFRVVSVDDTGVATLELVIDRVRMSARFGDGRPVEFDSREAKEVSPAFHGVSQTVGKPLARIRVAPTGELLSSKPLIGPELQSQVAAPAPATGSGGGKDDDPNKNFLVVFPPRPLRVGEGWRDQYKTRVHLTRQLTQEVTLLRQYELTGVKDGVATVELTTSVITPIHDPALAAQLIQKAPGGTIEFDLQRGLMTSRVLTVDQTEVGVIGSDSTMHAKTRLEERLVAERKAESGKPKAGS
jgi:hypothetical protein